MNKPTTQKPTEEQVQAALAWACIDADECDVTVAHMDILSSLRILDRGETKTDVTARILAAALEWERWEASESGFIATAWHEPSYFKNPFDAISIELVPSRDSEPRYAVRQRGNCLDKSGQWEWEPSPSARDAEFFARCRFATFEEARAAIGLARKEAKL